MQRTRGNSTRTGPSREMRGSGEGCGVSGRGAGEGFRGGVRGSGKGFWGGVRGAGEGCWGGVRGAGEGCDPSPCPVAARPSVTWPSPSGERGDSSPGAAGVTEGREQPPRCWFAAVSPAVPAGSSLFLRPPRTPLLLPLGLGGRCWLG